MFDLDGFITINLLKSPTTLFLLLSLDTKMEDCLMDVRLRLRRRSGRLSEEVMKKYFKICEDSKITIQQTDFHFVKCWLK